MNNNYKKAIILVLTILCLSFVVFAEDEGNSSTNAYDAFFEQNIDKEITVTIIENDINITGVLLKVFEDGIIVDSMFSTNYIPKMSIAYARVKRTDKK